MLNQIIRRPCRFVPFLLPLFLSVTFSGARAQSGRRPPRPSPPPSTAPPPASDAPARPADTDSRKPRIPVIVTSYLPTINSSSIYRNIVLEGCLERFKESSSFSATSEREMNRKEASDLAKKSSDSYILWIQLLVDAADTEVGIGPVNPYMLYVDFVLFTPGTGKVKTSGRVYQRRYGTIGGGPLPPVAGRMPVEQQLLRAGRETADRVMSALNVIPPPSH